MAGRTTLSIVDEGTTRGNFLLGDGVFKTIKDTTSVGKEGLDSILSAINSSFSGFFQQQRDLKGSEQQSSSTSSTSTSSSSSDIAVSAEKYAETVAKAAAEKISADISENVKSTAVKSEDSSVQIDGKKVAESIGISASDSFTKMINEQNRKSADVAKMTNVESKADSSVDAKIGELSKMIERVDSNMAKKDSETRASSASTSNAISGMDVAKTAVHSEIKGEEKTVKPKSVFGEEYDSAKAALNKAKKQIFGFRRKQQTGDGSLSAEDVEQLKKLHAEVKVQMARMNDARKKNVEKKKVDGTSENNRNVEPKAKKVTLEDMMRGPVVSEPKAKKVTLEDMMRGPVVSEPKAKKVTLEDMMRGPVVSEPKAKKVTLEDMMRGPVVSEPKAKKVTLEDMMRGPVVSEPKAKKVTLEDMMRGPVVSEPKAKKAEVKVDKPISKPAETVKPTSRASSLKISSSERLQKTAVLGSNDISSSKIEEIGNSIVNSIKELSNQQAKATNEILAAIASNGNTSTAESKTVVLTKAVVGGKTAKRGRIGV